MRPAPAVLLALIIAVAAPGCSTFDPDAPYSLIGGEERNIAIPEGAPIIEQPPVATEARSGHIDLEQDLVLRQGARPFYRLIDVAADAEGNIFVFDAGNHHIVAFDPDGAYRTTIGRQGAGPGELGDGGRIAIAGRSVVHVLRNRLNVWSIDGEILGSGNMTSISRLLPVEGTEDGGLVGLVTLRRRSDVRWQSLVRVGLDGMREVEYAELPWFGSLMVVQGSRGKNTGLPRPRADIAVAWSGEVYATAGTDYEVLALAADGSPRWVLRVAAPRTPLSDERIEQALRHLAGYDPDDDIRMPMKVSRSDVDWPEFLPALAGGSMVHRSDGALKVDGHGHLYVFPFIPDAWDRPDQPVDVYTADGERLFAGMIPMVLWDAARGDYVYGISTDPNTEEYTAVRYRLIEPF